VAIDESIYAACSYHSHFWQIKNPSPNTGFVDCDGDYDVDAADAVPALTLFFTAW
jgi:hypothetical protein